ncbi:MAG: HlyD family efflux transporter periplasmic adaptor subunit [Oscillospiraceae bacterium]
MNSKVIKISTVVLSGFMIIYVVCQMFRFGGNSYVSQTVYEQTVNRTIPVEGIFFRQETVIPVGSDGIVSCNYLVGDKVSTKTKLGSIYESQIAIDNQREIKNTEQLLHSLQAAQKGGDTSDIIKPEVLNKIISDYGEKLIVCRDDKDFTKMTDIRASLTEAYAKRDFLMNDEADYSAKIKELTLRLKDLKSSVGGQIKNFYSTVSGYFVDHVDGQESIMTAEYLQQLTAGKIVEYIKDYPGYKANSDSMKMVGDHNWRYVVTVSQEDSKALTTGQKASLKFSNLKENVSVTVESMELDKASGLYKVCFLGDTVNAFLLSTRVQSAEVMMQSYKGLKVPKEAIRFQGEQMGVYVLTMNKVYFRKVDVLYETDDFIISNLHYEDPDGFLALYDTVIVKGKDLYDQKPV